MKMPRNAAAGLTVILALGAGCAPLPSPTEPPAPLVQTDTPVAPLILTLAPPPTETQAAAPFLLDLTPEPTATALPTLVLPASPSVPLDVQVWDGLPTYPAESWPDMYFRLRYDPAAWARTVDQFGYPVLASRGVAGCQIVPSTGRGLPLSGSVDHNVRIVGDVSYQLSRVSIAGALQFVAYAGGDARMFTSFEVSFADQPDACIQAAETVLGTLRSVPLSEATPVAP